MDTVQEDYETRLKKLFVGGLNRNTSDDTVKDYFAKYGELEDCVVIKDSNTKVSRGFGYVTFSDHRCTFQVLAEKKEKGHNIDGKDVEVKRAIPRDDRNPTSHVKTKKIFIGGLKKDAEESDVREEIEKVLEGTSSIVKIDLIRDKETQEMRGFGFIEFEDEDTVDTLRCIKNLPIKGKMVEMKKAENRNKDGGGSGGGSGRGGGFGGRSGGGGRGGGYGMGRGGGYSHGGGGGYDASAYGAGGMYGAAAGGMGYGAAPYGGGYGGGFGGMGGMYGETNFGPQRSAYGGGMNGVGARNFGGSNRGAMGRYKPY